MNTTTKDTSRMDSSQRAGITFSDLLTMVRRKFFTFLLIFVVVVGVAAALAFLYPPIYVVKGTLVIKPGFEKPMIFSEDTSRSTIINRVDQQTINTIVNLLTSDEVLRNVVLQKGMVDTSNEQEVLAEVQNLRSAVSAVPISLSNLVSVSLKYRDPEAAVSDLNAILDSFIRYHIKINGFGDRGIEFFKEQVRSFKIKYTQLTEDLANRRKQQNIVNTSFQQDNHLKLIRDLEIRKTRLVEELRGVKSRMAYSDVALQAVDGAGEYVGLPAELVNTYPSLVEMEKTLAQLIINRQRAKSDYKETSKQVIDADDQYNNMRGEIKLFVKKVIRDLENQAEIIEESVADIDTKINASTELSGNLAALSTQMEMIELEQDSIRQNYRLYGAKLEEARINYAKDKEAFSNVAIASRPVIPGSPWFPQRTRIIGVAILLALILATLGSLIAYNLDRRMRDPEEARRRVNIPVITTIEGT